MFYVAKTIHLKWIYERKEKEMLGVVLVWMAAIAGMIMMKKMESECFWPYAVYAVTIATVVTVILILYIYQQ